MTVDEFLERFDPAVRETSRAAAALIHESVPGVIVRVHLGWNLIGYRCPAGRSSRYFCFIAPLDDHVRLGFEYGIALDDPDELLEGDGTQVRYVRLDGRKMPLSLRPLIREAAAVAQLPRGQIHEAIRARA